MAFCMNCGRNLPDGAKFCGGCGAAFGEAKKESAERKVVYDGEIHKCPNCGEVLGSFVAICPSCGHEISSKEVSSALISFTNKVDELERLIATSSKNQSGWKSWSTSSKIAWIIANIFLIGIPALLYIYFLPFIFIKNSSKLSPEEKQLVALIENTTFPNDRESIISALIYAKEKADFLSKKSSAKSIFWFNTWYSKAEQLKQKADILFPNDSIIKQSFAEIVADKKVNKIKTIVGLIIIIVILAFVMVRCSIVNNDSYNDVPPSSTTVENQDSSNDNQASSNDIQLPSNEDTNTSFESVTPTLDGEIVTNSNQYLQIKDVGYTMSGKYLTCIVTITNSSSNTAIEYPEFRVTVYDKDGTILGTEERVLSIIYPNQNFIDIGTSIEISEKPYRIVVTALVPRDSNLIPVSTMNHPTHKQMIGKNISIMSNKITGEVYNPNDYDIESAMVVILLKDEQGVILSNIVEFIKQIPANGSVPFETLLFSDSKEPKKVEVYAYIW